MNYIQQLNTFESLCTGTLSAKSQLIYYKLFKWANRFGLDNTFQLSNLQLMAECCISNEKTFIANRDVLKDKGFIEVKQGKKGHPTKYRLIDLTVKYTGNLQVHSTVHPTVNPTVNTTVNPTVNPTAIYKEREREKEKHKARARVDDFSSCTQNELLLSALRDFAEMRKAIKKPLTNRAGELILSKLEKMAETDEEKIAILNQSIENSWQGVFPLKNQHRQAEAEPQIDYEEKRRREREACNRRDAENAALMAEQMGWNK